MSGRSADLVARLAEAGEAGDWRELPGLLRAQLFDAVPKGPLDERPITVDQTHVSVVVGQRLVVKWMRAPVRHPRAVDLLGHLAAVGFRATPTPYAAVFTDDARTPAALVALVTAYLPDARDGWDWCVEAVVDHFRGTGPADLGPVLGDLTARLHAALATPSPVFAEPVRWSADPVWRLDRSRVLTEAVELTGRAGGEPQPDDECEHDRRWLAERVEALRADMAAASLVDQTWVMPLHGDLHVGQVLRWRDGDAVADFDGNPVLRGEPLQEPAARDVAQMRTSLAHVAQVANRRTEGRYAELANTWTEQTMRDFLTAYRHGLADAGVEHVFDERLLRPFEVEQECRELVYAARFLPRWRYAPMAVLRSWYE